MKPLLAIAALGAALVLAACSQDAVLEKVSTPEDRAIATAVIADLQRGSAGDADLMARVEPVLKGQLQALLPQLHALTPGGPEANAKLVSANTSVRTTKGVRERVGYVAYDVWHGERHALVQVVVLRRDGNAVVESLYVNPLTGPASELNAFSLAGKSPAHYLVLALTALCLAIILASEVVLLRTRGVRRKWLWFIGCAFGYGQISINWTTGALAVAPLYVQLLGAFAVKPGGLAPWQVGFGLPIVSIIFLLRHHRRRRAGAATPVAVAN